jgi:ATP synthase protein I
MLIGLINIRYLAVKTIQITDYAAGLGKRRFSLGFVTRLCISLIGIMIAVRFEQVSLAATLIGIFLIPVLLIPVSIIHTYRSNKL